MPGVLVRSLATGAVLGAVVAAVAIMPGDDVRCATVVGGLTSTPVPSTVFHPTAAKSVQTVVRPLGPAMVAAADRAADPSTTLGAAVIDLRTGELSAGAAGHRTFLSASLSKLMIVVDMLERKVALSSADLAMIDRALGQSDDEAMNALWENYDGPAAVRRVVDRLHLTSTRSPDNPLQWGQTVVSAADYARLFAHVMREMDDADRKVITHALGSATREAADGFDQFFGLLGRPATRYAKQGWMWFSNEMLLHSAGVVHDEQADCDYVVVLLSTRPDEGSTVAGKEYLSTVADAVLDVLTRAR